MEYQFDYATFCKTFNVKDDKAIDSLRLTHTQDINFKLFPYKASGKTQAPIITELEEVVSDFFRKSLKLESEPVQYESLCDNIITEMDIEDEDIEIFKEMIHSLFFEGDNFVAKNLGLYPYQTKVNNKSVDRLAGFLIDVLGLNGNDCNIIEQAMKNYPYNVVEKLVVDAIQTSKIGSTNNNKSYFPVVIGVQEKFKNDFYFMLNTGMTSLDDLDELEQCEKHVKMQLHRRDTSKKKIDEIDNYLSVDIDEKALNRIFKRIKELEKEILIEEVNLSSLQQKRITLHKT